MDEATGWCRGCARSIEEISVWGHVGEGFRSQVWRLLPQRRLELSLQGAWLGRPVSEEPT